MNMEIPEMNMISHFEAAGINLQNPSSISRFFSIPLLKWGALIFAIFATFNSIIKRIKLVLIRVHTVKLPSSNQNDDVVDFDEDDEISLASSDDEISDDEEIEEENSPTTPYCRGQRLVDDNFGVKGSFNWSEFSNCGKNVVKLWDSLGLSLDFDEDLINCDSNGVVSMWDFDQNQKTREYSGGNWNSKGNGVVLCGYDSRMRRRTPAVYGEWSSPAEEVAAAAGGGVGKVYVRDDVRGVVTVGDVRNMRMPLGSVRESDGETCWDANAVIVENEFEESKSK